MAQFRRSISGKIALAFFASVLALGIAIEVNGTSRAEAATLEGRFITRCTLAHQLPDDPIVKPRQPGASHLHDFFANTTTNAFSTHTTLRSGGTTCVNKKDLSAYWVPALSVDGSPALPTFVAAYYKSAGKTPASVQTIPPGLRVVAGDAMATAPQSQRFISWDCGQFGGVAPRTTVPTCRKPTLELHVKFPDCWNGKDLDSADHKSHLAYVSTRTHKCPATHPVPIPVLRLNVHYTTTGGPGTTLASMRGMRATQFTGHADFFNAWDPSELRRLMTKCINAGILCNAKA